MTATQTDKSNLLQNLNLNNSVTYSCKADKTPHIKQLPTTISRVMSSANSRAKPFLQSAKEALEQLKLTRENFVIALVASYS